MVLVLMFFLSSTYGNVHFLAFPPDLIPHATAVHLDTHEVLVVRTLHHLLLISGALIAQTHVTLQAGHYQKNNKNEISQIFKI